MSLHHRVSGAIAALGVLTTMGLARASSHR